MIRKPTDRDFREGTAVRAIRETRKVTVEGAQGVAQGFHKLLLIWFGGIMAFGLVMSLIATVGLPLIPFVLLGFFAWQSHRKRAGKQLAMLRAQSHDPPRATDPACEPSAAADSADVAFPADVRRHGCVEADIGAVVQQAFVFFAIGAILMVFFGSTMGGVGVIVGMMFVMLAVIIGSRIFGDRKLIEWDTRTVKVWHLLSEGQMQWSDVVDVTVEKAGRTDLPVYFQSGSRRNIVLLAPHNRLGGPTTLRVPIRYMNLPQDELTRLVRDLMCWRAAGNSIAAGVSHAPPAAAGPDPVAITPSTDPRLGFDPDAIIARHLRERQESLALLGQETPAGRSDLAGLRPVFGRKRS